MRREQGKYGSRLLALALATVLAGCAAPYALAQDQDDIKGTFLISSVPKGGLSAEDRQVVALYLAARPADLRPAPYELASRLAETRRWSEEYQRYAQPLPRRLDRVIAPPAEGTFRVVFDRAVLVVRAETGEVIDRVPASR
jgi:hypothetical protein